jgi:hypothetical protein
MPRESEGNAVSQQYVYEVELADAKGSRVTVHAVSFRIRSGCLAFTDGHGWTRAYAAGAWKSIVRVEREGAD